MKIVFLDVGTSMGAPMLGCGCKTCACRNPRNTRRRASLLLKADGMNIIIDTAPDFREQALASKLCRLDATILPHSHADRVCGFDDICRFNDLQSEPIPVYGTAETLADLSRMFPCIHKKPPPGIAVPFDGLEITRGAQRRQTATRTCGRRALRL